MLLLTPLAARYCVHALYLITIISTHYTIPFMSAFDYGCIERAVNLSFPLSGFSGFAGLTYFS